MILNPKAKSTLTAVIVFTLLAAGKLALVADEASSPASVARARISSLTGVLLDTDGKPLSVGSELKVGDVIKTPAGEPASLILTGAGAASSLICIQPGSEVSFTRLAPSTDPDYPLLDAELTLRNGKVRADAKQVF